MICLHKSSPCRGVYEEDTEALKSGDVGVKV